MPKHVRQNYDQPERNTNPRFVTRQETAWGALEALLPPGVEGVHIGDAIVRNRGRQRGAGQVVWNSIHPTHRPPSPLRRPSLRTSQFGYNSSSAFGSCSISEFGSANLCSSSCSKIACARSSTSCSLFPNVGSTSFS